MGEAVKTPMDVCAKDELNFSSYRYLIIDDNRHMVVLLREILKSFGAVHIREFTAAAAAIELMETMSFDLVLVDGMMAPMSGLDFLRRVRGLENGINRRVPIIFVSAYTDKEMVLAAWNAGANAVIAKPVSPENLLRHLSACLFKQSPFIVSSNYIGPCRPIEADAALAAIWARGEALPSDVTILPPQPLSRKR